MRLIPILANAGAIAAGLALGTGLSPAGGAAPVAAEAPPATRAERAAREGPAPHAPESPDASQASDTLDGPDTFDAFAFRRAFIVPVADGWRTQSLVVLSLELRRPHGAVPVTRAQEARLRDRLVATLMTSGQEGAFADPLTDDHAALEALLTDAAMPVLVDARVRVTEIAKRPV